MELGTVEEVELIVDQIASNKIPPPNKAQSLVIIRQMVRMAKRIAELEKQLAANNPLLDEAADKIDAMEKQIHALENCRLFAARNRKESWALLILGFLAEAGVVGSITREEKTK